jgi:hypothetical protein
VTPPETVIGIVEIGMDVTGPAPVDPRSAIVRGVGLPFMDGVGMEYGTSGDIHPTGGGIPSIAGVDKR